MKSQAHNSLFKASGNRGNAVLNFRRDPKSEFAVYGRSFWKAASQLAEELNKARGYSDLDACPIVFLYRHALELFLKAVVNCGQAISVIIPPTDPLSLDGMKGHKLSSLLPAVRKTFEMVGWEWNLELLGCRTFVGLQQFLSSIDKVDPGSYSFRYPVTKDGEGSVSHHFVFNVLEFASEMEKLLPVLEAAVDGLRATRDELIEAYVANF